MNTPYELSSLILGNELFETLVSSKNEAQEHDSSATSLSPVFPRVSPDEEAPVSYSSSCLLLDITDPAANWWVEDGSDFLQGYSDHLIPGDLDNDDFMRFCNIPEEKPISDEELDTIFGAPGADTTECQHAGDLPPCNARNSKEGKQEIFAR